MTKLKKIDLFSISENKFASVYCISQVNVLKLINLKVVVLTLSVFAR